ncbi:MAG TPA: signal peptide peptidase SppA [Myxococcales bacterium]|jgi:protease-4
MDRKSVVVLGVIFGGLFLALFAFLLLAYAAVKGGGEDGGSFGGPAIGVVEVKGTIVNVDKQLKALRKFTRDDKIKAVLVRIDSPGGAVAPSQEIYDELRKIQKKKPVVCSMGNVAASGGFYIAAGCGKVLALPGTLTGSIGVISQMPNLTRIADWAKFDMNTIKSGKLKDVGNPFRPMSDDDREFFQKLTNGIYEQFLEAVATGRNLKVEDVRPVADGRVLTGKEAFELKLVDQLGNFNDAIKLAAELGKIEGDEPKLQYPPEENPFKFEDFMKEGGRALFKGVKQEATSSAGVDQEIVGPALLMTMPSPSR